MQFKRHGLAAVLCCTIFLIGSAASAAIFGLDDRVQPNSALARVYDPVGVVQFGIRRATGVVVSPCYAITVQHVIEQRSAVVGARVLFTAGLASHSPAATGATVVASGGLEKVVNATDAALVRGSDWALLRLDKCLGRSLGYAVLVAGLPPAPHMASAGFPGGKSPRNGPLIDPDCSITSARPLVWLNDCATVPGDSGGPIFQLSAATESSPAHLRMYAMQSAGLRQKRPMPYLAGLDNLATPTWEILGHIATIINSDMDRGETVN